MRRCGDRAWPATPPGAAAHGHSRQLVAFSGAWARAYLGFCGHVLPKKPLAKIRSGFLAKPELPPSGLIPFFISQRATNGPPPHAPAPSTASHTATRAPRAPTLPNLGRRPNPNCPPRDAPGRVPANLATATSINRIEPCARPSRQAFFRTRSHQRQRAPGRSQATDG